MKFTEEMAEEFMKSDREGVEKFNAKHRHILSIFELSRFNELYNTEFIIKDGLFVGTKR